MSVKNENMPIWVFLCRRISCKMDMDVCEDLSGDAIKYVRKILF